MDYDHDQYELFDLKQRLDWFKIVGAIALLITVAVLAAVILIGV